MMVKRKMSQEITTETEPLAIEEATSSESKLRKNLEEIKTHEGVIGYIFRNSKSAAIDLKDPTKIIDYAVLSSSSIETGEELSQLFDLGQIKNVVVEGKEAKVLSLVDNQNRISIFTEKNVDVAKLIKKLY
jgi:predicted regulator of Ras-like GTPase activity (Roadblock/LC7/MglB family)